MVWLPSERLRGLGPFAEPRINRFYDSLASAGEESLCSSYLERGCFVCRNLLDCRCDDVDRLSPPVPPCCPSPELCAADCYEGTGLRNIAHDQWLGSVQGQWCDHRQAFRNGPRGGNHWQWERRPWRGMQRRWLVSDGSPEARDVLLAEWSALDFSAVRRRAVQCAPSAEETRWALFRSAEERAAESAAAELEAVADWAWVLKDIVRASNSLADLKADTCVRWRTQIASARYRQRHCVHCEEGEEWCGFGQLARRGTVLYMREQRPATAKRACTKTASQEHSWTWTVPPKQRAEELHRLPALLVSGLSKLQHKAALAEAWADAFESRWGQERAAAAGVRDAVLRTRNNVEQIAQVRDEMESIAREEKISLKLVGAGSRSDWWGLGFCPL